MKKLLFIALPISILAVFVLTSCKKNKDEIEISGRVFDSSNNQYLADAKVKLGGNGVQSGVYTPGFTDIASVQTDANGNFSFTVKKDKSDSFRLTVSKDQYFPQVFEFSSAVFSQSSTFTKDIEMPATGTLQVRIRNAYPDDYDDKIVFYFSNSDLVCLECCTNTHRTGNGPTFDTTITCKFYGNSNIVLLRSVTKNQQTNVYFDSLYCPSFSTAEYEILY
jgi:hypothetical protein